MILFVLFCIYLSGLVMLYDSEFCAASCLILVLEMGDQLQEISVLLMISPMCTWVAWLVDRFARSWSHDGSDVAEKHRGLG